MTTKQEVEKENKGLSREVEKLDSEKTLATALVAAFGLVIGLSWNELIKAYFASLGYLNSLHSSLIQTLLVTLIGVVAIMTITKTLRKKDS
jgi:hypothetical protein